jgi:hypothetical protein
MNWTAPILCVLMWLQLLTGLGSIKDELLGPVTLGLLNPATAGKLHAVRLPLVTGLLAYLHAVVGFQIMARRLKWIKHKGTWEIGIWILGALGVLQFLLLYFG